MTRRVSRAVEDYAYDWACGLHTNKEFKSELAEYGYSIDLRQADIGNVLEVVEVKTGLYYDIEI
jgi:hypothetical protein